MILVSCARCREPMLAVDRVCPHCGVTRESPRRASTAIAMLGALTGCFPIGEPAYGVADSGTSDWSESSGTESMSTTYDGPYTTTTSPGTTQGTSPTPDPTNYTMGDESSSEGDASTSTSGDDTSTDTGSDTSGSDGETSSGSSSDDGSSEGGSSST